MKNSEHVLNENTENTLKNKQKVKDHKIKATRFYEFKQIIVHAIFHNIFIDKFILKLKICKKVMCCTKNREYFTHIPS